MDDCTAAHHLLLQIIRMKVDEAPSSFSSKWFVLTCDEISASHVELENVAHHLEEFLSLPTLADILGSLSLSKPAFRVHLMSGEGRQEGAGSALWHFKGGKGSVPTMVATCIAEVEVLLCAIALGAGDATALVCVCSELAWAFRDFLVSEHVGLVLNSAVLPALGLPVTAGDTPGGVKLGYVVCGGSREVEMLEMESKSNNKEGAAIHACRNRAPLHAFEFDVHHSMAESVDKPKTRHEHARHHPVRTLLAAKEGTVGKAEGTRASWGSFVHYAVQVHGLKAVRSLLAAPVPAPAMGLHAFSALAPIHLGVSAASLERAWLEATFKDYNIGKAPKDEKASATRDPIGSQ
eukprot:gene11374-13446_t